MIRYKGASYSPGDLSPGKNGIKCHVMLLDGKRETVEMNVSHLCVCIIIVYCVEYRVYGVNRCMCVAFPAGIRNRMCAQE